MTIPKRKIGPTFSERVVKMALSIPAGRVTTYGRIARAAGGGGQAARSVSAILGNAYDKGAKVPFHRIVYSNGQIWVSPKYHKKRLALYKKEGIKIDRKARIENFKNILLDF